MNCGLWHPGIWSIGANSSLKGDGTGPVQDLHAALLVGFSHSFKIYDRSIIYISCTCLQQVLPIQSSEVQRWHMRFEVNPLAKWNASDASGFIFIQKIISHAGYGFPMYQDTKSSQVSFLKKTQSPLHPMHTRRSLVPLTSSKLHRPGESLVAGLYVSFWKLQGNPRKLNGPRVTYPCFIGINCLLCQLTKHVINRPVLIVQMAGYAREEPSAGKGMPSTSQLRKIYMYSTLTLYTIYGPGVCLFCFGYI